MDRLKIDAFTPGQVRDALGANFAHNMVARVDERLDVDVLVIDIKGDAYVMKVADRNVLVIKRTTAWFRQNFSLAHELGHITSDTLHPTVAEAEASTEAMANAFAAELLMPEAKLRALDWARMSTSEFAQHIWDLGVSVSALINRLSTLRLPISPDIESVRAENTFALLRHFWMTNTQAGQVDPITLRREKSAQRYIPAKLINQLETAVLAGRAPQESLAYLLDIPVDELGLDKEDTEDLESDVSLLESIFL